MWNETALEELIELYKTGLGEEISRDSAREVALRLITLYEVLRLGISVWLYGGWSACTDARSRCDRSYSQTKVAKCNLHHSFSRRRFRGSSTATKYGMLSFSQATFLELPLSLRALVVWIFASW